MILVAVGCLATEATDGRGAVNVVERDGSADVYTALCCVPTVPQWPTESRTASQLCYIRSVMRHY